MKLHAAGGRTLIHYTDRMNYDEVSSQAQALTYRDKLRLAQLLIQWARKEEEEHDPALRSAAGECASSVSGSVQYVADRLKTKPGTKKKLLNAIGAMFQFRGGISDSDKEKVVAQLQEMRFLTVTGDNRVLYLNSVSLGWDPRNTPRQAN